MALSLISLMWATNASAYGVLYAFQDTPDGGFPAASLLAGPSGVFFGTTVQGGAGHGAVYEAIPPAVSGGAWTDSVLYAFTGGTDGGSPEAAVVTGPSGTLYGTTASGGASAFGTVFQLTPPATTGNPWTETVLYSFTGGTDGKLPFGNVVRGKNGVLYGTASAGGASGAGTIFSLTPPTVAGNPWTFTLLYTFTGGTDGASPEAGLLLGTTGTLSGTTMGGGVGALGTVFTLAPPAVIGGTWSEKVLHSFAGGSDGSNPISGLVVNSQNTLFGTTELGGTDGAGTVFSITQPSHAPPVAAILYFFTGGVDGDKPFGGVTLAGNGTLYGTTALGGMGGDGTLFGLKPPAVAGGRWTELVLHSFTKGNDGAFPEAGVIIGAASRLYGTTEGGGAFGAGTIFFSKP